MKIPIGVLPSPYVLAAWGQSRPLLVDEVRAYAVAGKIKYDQLQRCEDHLDLVLHTRRAAYFFLSNDKTPIRVRVHQTPAGEPYLWVEDGFHRLAGAIARGDAEIEALHDRSVAKYLRNSSAMSATATATNTENKLGRAILRGCSTALKGMLIPIAAGALGYLFTYPAGALSCHYYALNKELPGRYSWWECYVQADGKWYTKQEYQSAKVGGLLVVDKPVSVALEAAK